MGPHTGSREERISRAVSDLGELVEIPIALNAPDMRPLAAMPHAGPLDASRLAMLLGKPVADAVRQRLTTESGIYSGRAPQRIAAFPGLELGRVHLPVRTGGGELVGHLWAIDSAGAVSETAWLRLQRAADSTLPAVLHDESARGSAHGLELDRLLARHRTYRIVAVDLLAPPVFDPGGSVGFSPLARVLQQVGTERSTVDWSVARDPDGAELLVAGGPAETLSRHALGRVLEDAVRHVNARTHAIGRVALFVSPALFTSHEVHDHLQSARSVAAATMGGASEVVFADDLPSYELLVEVGRITPIGRLEVPRALRVLLETDRGRTVARTAKAFLDNGGNAGRTATALGVHRGTLYYRLASIEEQTGFDLERGDHRVALHLGLTAALLAGAL